MFQDISRSSHPGNERYLCHRRKTVSLSMSSTRPARVWSQWLAQGSQLTRGNKTRIHQLMTFRCSWRRHRRGNGLPKLAPIPRIEWNCRSQWRQQHVGDDLATVIKELTPLGGPTAARGGCWSWAQMCNILFLTWDSPKKHQWNKISRVIVVTWDWEMGSKRSASAIRARQSNGEDANGAEILTETAKTTILK
jgi:hypothetical protein